MSTPEKTILICGTSKTPRGWRCTRELGHDGPCAAVHASMDPDAKADLVEAAKEVVEAYGRRFGAGPANRFVGPIDDEVMRLQSVLKGLE